MSKAVTQTELDELIESRKEITRQENSIRIQVRKKAIAYLKENYGVDATKLGLLWQTLEVPDNTIFASNGPITVKIVGQSSSGFATNYNTTIAEYRVPREVAFPEA